MTEINELEMRSEASYALTAAKVISVKSNTDYESAGNLRKEIKDSIKKISAYWSPKKDQAFQLHKSLVAAEKEMTAPLEQADKIIDQRMGEYRREVERQRMEAERERLRLEAEARAKAEEAQRLADEAANKEELDDDDVEILQIAQADLVASASLADCAPIAPVMAKVQGISVRKVWKARVIDESKVPVSLNGWLIRPIDLPALNKLASGSAGHCECPGVEFYQDEITQVRL